MGGSIVNRSMGRLDSDKSLIFFDSKDDDDRATVFLDHHGFSPSGVDQLPEMVFCVLGGLCVHGGPCRFIIMVSVLAILAIFAKMFTGRPAWR